jgi:hypothetical protein
MTSAEPALSQDFEEKKAPTANNAAEMRHLVHDIDYLLTSVNIDRIGQLSFAINDIPFHVTHSKDVDSASRVCIQAVLGYLPFSFNGRENRQAILAILQDSHALFNVRFGLDPHGRIFAAGNFTTDTLTAPDFIFYPLVCFLQEAQPFIDLIGQYL